MYHLVNLAVATLQSKQISLLLIPFTKLFSFFFIQGLDPTAQALENCEKLVLRPYRVFLKAVSHCLVLSLKLDCVCIYPPLGHSYIVYYLW